MSNANLSGPIPRELGNLSNLIELNLRGNSLVGSIPFSFGALTCLTDLDLSDNQLEDVIPYPLGNLSNLKTLYLSGNRLSGEVPNSVGQLSNLESLDISSNSLHGVISDLHFINLSSLSILRMSFNSFSFNFSSHFEFPSQLEIINLQSCNLGPSFPVWLKSQIMFTDLDISSNGISDGVPEWFWNLPLGLLSLNLSSNELMGTLPDITLRLDQYHGLDLSNNCFEGRVSLLPSKIASLNLSGNKFKGNLSFLCHNDGNLTFIDLSNNSFSGSLPDCWSQFQKLVVLDLSYNNLSGNIPLSFGFLTQLEALYLRKNAFVGEVPMSLSNCTNLRFMDLGENNLCGKIPVWIGERLTGLYCLVLRSNMFSGSLPPQICWLSNLHILDLSKNNLAGNLPNCFGNFSSMSNRSGDDVRTNYSSSHTYGYAFYIPQVGTHDDYPAEEIEGFNDNALVAWKGTYRSFGRTNLNLLNIIDLSNNNLSGEFPFEITRLVELVSLNFSLNKLHGYLDLSYNNLSGKIPTGTQLQGFNSTSYEGNPLLYGPPITSIFGPKPATTIIEEDDNDIHGDDGFWKSYYTGMGAGFAVGFWGICGAIFLNRRCRHLLFASLSLAKDWIYVTVVLFRKLKRF
ncbi:receptor-like protein EIX2 [Rutidosis leptorrhynchoides]|uniref:receptor-like protein EIX2 n=1 Tax=Rutidosis leptorrhynchoides TaxID=125765 RepID=UPI003A99E7E1